MQYMPWLLLMLFEDGQTIENRNLSLSICHWCTSLEISPVHSRKKIIICACQTLRDSLNAKHTTLTNEYCIHLRVIHDSTLKVIQDKVQAGHIGCVWFYRLKYFSRGGE